MTKFKVVIISVFVGLAVCVGVGIWYVNAMFEDVIVSDEELEVNDLKVNPDLIEKTDNVENFALFGVDCVNENYTGCRSDLIIVASFNKDTHGLTLSSVPRDLYTAVEGHGFDKLNHAYAFGGAGLAVQTLNATFDLDIEHFVSVNFNAAKAIIDALGGVTIAVKDYEVSQIDGIQSAGTYRLTGSQALQYSRIRKVGNGDFERMERQRYVMEQTLAELEDLSLTKVFSLGEALLPMVRTNLSLGELTKLGTNVLTGGMPELTDQQVPSTEEGRGVSIDGIYYFAPTMLVETTEKFHSLIHPSLTYRPSRSLTDLANAIESKID